MSAAAPNPNPPGHFASSPRPPEPPHWQPPTRIVLEQGGFFGRWGGRLGWLAFLIALIVIYSMYSKYQSYFQTSPGLEERYYSLSPIATDKVAIIDIEGVIMHSDGFAKWQIDRVRHDPSIKAVVVRIDSPGGTVTGSNYLYHQLMELAKERNIKLVVSMGGICASGGYYTAMAVGATPDSIFAEPSTWTGSIGVVIPHYDLTGLLEKLAVTDDSIVSNPLKLTGSPTRKFPPELAEKEKAILQGLVDDSFKEFKDIVKSGRPKFQNDDKALDAVATGQVFSSSQALDKGLVDKTGYIEDAIDRAIALNNLSKDSVRVVKYSRPKGLLDDVLGGPLGENQRARLDLATLLDLTAPRAYYLCTWLPAIAATRE
ncbi:MAG TPA: signal peptide peptidase SppA [Pirellulales bacterium]|jgi:protease-4|nr:signal peptide peptidase SppA [Pirellulales bacterium]